MRHYLHCPPGVGVDETQRLPGDFLLARTGDAAGRIVRLGQAARGAGHFAYWNHAAVYTGFGRITEAVPSGVRLTKLDDLVETDYTWVRPSANDAQRKAVVAFALDRVGERYGALAALATGISVLVGRGFPWRPAGWTCSGLVADALLAGGLIKGAGTASALPCDLAEAFGVFPPGTILATRVPHLGLVP